MTLRGRVIAASFDPDSDRLGAARIGGIARAAIEHRARFERRLHEVTDGLWSVVTTSERNQISLVDVES